MKKSPEPPAAAGPQPGMGRGVSNVVPSPVPSVAHKLENRSPASVDVKDL